MKTQPKPISEITHGKPLLTMKAAARTLAISTKTVQRLLANSSLDCIRIGKSVRIPIEALERFVDKASHSTQRSASSGFVKPRVP